MPIDANFESELGRLVDHFGKHLAEFKSGGFDVADARAGLIVLTRVSRPSSSRFRRGELPIPVPPSLPL